jgi:hypothetical protein
MRASMPSTPPGVERVERLLFHRRRFRDELWRQAAISCCSRVTAPVPIQR